jgi:HSP20 family protein
MNESRPGFATGIAPLMRLHDEMDRMFEGFFEDLPPARPYARAWPALNTWEDADGAWIEAELPGLGMDDVELLVSGADVTINGERKAQDPKGAAWYRRERSHGRFSRTLTLPWPIDADKVEAKLQDGVLTIRLPRSESTKPKKVKVLSA